MDAVERVGEEPLIGDVCPLLFLLEGTDLGVANGVTEFFLFKLEKVDADLIDGVCGTDELFGLLSCLLGVGLLWIIAMVYFCYLFFFYTRTTSSTGCQFLY